MKSLPGNGFFQASLVMCLAGAVGVAPHLHAAAPSITPQEIRHVQEAAQAVIEMFQACRQGQPYADVKRLVDQHQAELAAFDFFTGMILEAVQSPRAFTKLSEPDQQQGLATLEAFMRLHVGWCVAETKDQFMAWHDALPPSQKSEVETIFHRSEIKTLEEPDTAYVEKRRQILMNASNRLAQARTALASGKKLTWPSAPLHVPHPAVASPVSAVDLGLTWVHHPTQLIVASVAPSSAAAKGRFRAGDRVLAVEQTKVDSSEDFSLAVGMFAPGDRLKISVERGEHRVILWLELPGDHRGAKLQTLQTLSLLASRQAEDPLMGDRASRLLEAYDQIFALYLDDDLEGNDLSLRLRNMNDVLQSLGEPPYWPKDTPRTAEEEFDTVVSMIQKSRREERSAFQERKWRADFWRILLRASSHEEFIRQLLAAPKETRRKAIPHFMMDFFAPFWPKDLPRSPGQWTDDHFHRARRAFIMMVTPAAKEWARQATSSTP